MALLKYALCDDDENTKKILQDIIDFKSLGYDEWGNCLRVADFDCSSGDAPPDLIILGEKFSTLSGIQAVLEITAFFEKQKLLCPGFVLYAGRQTLENAVFCVEHGILSYARTPSADRKADFEHALSQVAGRLRKKNELDVLVKAEMNFELKDFLFRLVVEEKLPGLPDNLSCDFLENAAGSSYACVSFCFDYISKISRPELGRSIKNSFLHFISDYAFVNSTYYLFLKTDNIDLVNSCIQKIAGMNLQRTFICRSDCRRGLEGLLEAYRQVLSFQRYLFYISSRPFICAADVYGVDSDEGGDASEIDSVLDEFVFCIETYDKKKLAASTERLYGILYRLHLAENEAKKNMIYCLMELRSRMILKYPERDISEGLTFDVITDILPMTTYEDCFYYVKNVLNKFIENFNYNTSDAAIVKVIAYVRNNFSSDLKLETLGELFDCNSAYLGKKFKKYTGKQFNAYLDDLRIGLAKEKLLNTDLRIYQISKLVGYANTDYFFMKFKKYTGLTPREFQKQSGLEVPEQED